MLVGTVNSFTFYAKYWAHAKIEIKFTRNLDQEIEHAWEVADRCSTSDQGEGTRLSGSVNLATVAQKLYRYFIGRVLSVVGLVHWRNVSQSISISDHVPAVGLHASVAPAPQMNFGCSQRHLAQ